MGILLKETLKGICNSNQWSYGVFWKIAYQNPKLLIWEECYYEALPSHVPAALERGSNRFGIEAENEVCLLIDKMMLNNQINVVGEGIVGRAAFSGNHFWILSKSYNRNTHPPEVLNELHHQFSSGIQTIAVIPIFPHGVVQLGSSLAIMENMRFVNEVKSLILQVGSIPGALLPEDNVTKNSGVDGNYLGHSCLLSETVDHNLNLSTSSLNYCNSTVTSSVMPNHSLHEEWFNRLTSFDFQPGFHQSSGGYDCLKLMDQQILPGFGLECEGNNNPSAMNSFNLSPLRISGGLVQNPGFSQMDVSLSSMMNQLSNFDHFKIDDISSKFLNTELIDEDKRLSENTEVELLEQNRQECGNRNSRLQNCKHTSGDDLFDVLGVKLKKKLLDGESSPWNLGVDDSRVYDTHDSALLSESYSSIGVSDYRKFSYSDHLLDSVVSGGCLTTKQSSEDKTSQKTTLTKTISSLSPSFSCAGTSDPLQSDLFELSSQLSSSGNLDARSTKSGCGDMRSSSQSDSVYVSQISSWVEQGKSVRQDNSVSAACSKRPTEVNKLNRKRPKPGESSRPRPKDRQMFQDRLKELREIVPNGAKYSIDALLERTVKHMLFLQSVTKHADKLKGVSKEGGLFLKDNIEGGATWAFEVGSESMVCPLIVKDLNTPRQMLVEMLCEDGGFFLEIADLIPGLGLTILKGVMETKINQILARFVVEANRDVTRMEIFMSLVHLLEQSMKGGGPCLADATNIGNDHLMVRNSSPQTAPILATGRID